MSAHRIQVLDHGYIETVDSWGSDEDVIRAARMSTDKGFLGWGPVAKCTWCLEPQGGKTLCATGGGHHVWQSGFPGDEKLLRYLWENKHSTPFEFAGLVVEVQAPIFVFREWHRHRTWAYNEMSARYAPLPDLNYLPTVERLMMGGGHLTKQAASTGSTLTFEKAQEFRNRIERQYDDAEQTYQMGLVAGVPKELARVVVPVGRYSRMRATANLRNLLAFITLRSAPNAQWEIRQFSDALGSLVSQQFPRTWLLFSEDQ